MKEVLVICGKGDFERYCMETGHDRKSAREISSPFQLDLYPDAEIVFYGNFASNACMGSQELRKKQDAEAHKELIKVINEARNNETQR